MPIQITDHLASTYVGLRVHEFLLGGQTTTLGSPTSLLTQPSALSSPDTAGLVRYLTADSTESSKLYYGRRHYWYDPTGSGYESPGWRSFTAPLVQSETVQDPADSASKPLNKFLEFPASTSGATALTIVAGVGGIIREQFPKSIALSVWGPATADISLANHFISGVAYATAADHAASKQYVDDRVQGLKPKGSAFLATNGPVNGGNTTYNAAAGTLTFTDNGAIVATDIDSTSGDAITTDKIFLVKNEVLSYKNGLYAIQQVGTGSTPAILVRATNADSNTELLQAYVFIEAGGSGGNAYIQTSTTFDITAPSGTVVWDIFSQSTNYTAGGGITKVGSGFYFYGNKTKGDLYAATATGNYTTGLTTVAAPSAGDFPLVSQANDKPRYLAWALPSTLTAFQMYRANSTANAMEVVGDVPGGFTDSPAKVLVQYNESGTYKSGWGPTVPQALNLMVSGIPQPGTYFLTTGAEHQTKTGKLLLKNELVLSKDATMATNGVVTWSTIGGVRVYERNGTGVMTRPIDGAAVSGATIFELSNTSNPASNAFALEYKTATTPTQIVYFDKDQVAFFSGWGGGSAVASLAAATGIFKSTSYEGTGYAKAPLVWATDSTAEQALRVENGHTTFSLQPTRRWEWRTYVPSTASNPVTFYGRITNPGNTAKLWNWIEVPSEVINVDEPRATGVIFRSSGRPSYSSAATGGSPVNVALVTDLTSFQTGTTLEMASANASITISPTGPQDLSTPRLWTFTFDPTQHNHDSLYAKLGASRTLNRLTKWTTGTSTITDSLISDDGTTISALGRIDTVAPTTSRASIRLPHGSTPTTPSNGDLWSTTSALLFRLNGATKTVAFTDSNITGSAAKWTNPMTLQVSTDLSGSVAFDGGTTPVTLAATVVWLNGYTTYDGRYLKLSGGTLTGNLTTVAASTGGSGLTLPPGASPTTPVDGDLWYVTGALKFRLGASTKDVAFTDSNITGSSGKWAADITLSLTGDASGSVAFDGGTPNETLNVTLASLITAGSVGSATSVPVLTYDAKGRLTAVSSATITTSGIGAVPTSRTIAVTGANGVTVNGTIEGTTTLDLSANRTYTIGLSKLPLVQRTAGETGVTGAEAPLSGLVGIWGISSPVGGTDYPYASATGSGLEVRQSATSHLGWRLWAPATTSAELWFRKSTTSTSAWSTWKRFNFKAVAAFTGTSLASTFNVTHGLGTEDISSITVRRRSDKVMIETGKKIIDQDTVQIVFGYQPGAGETFDVVVSA